MLRVTVHEASESQTLKLEGKLAGPWVEEARSSLQRILASEPRPSVRLDLTGLTMIDQTGKAFLAEAHAQGAQFVAAGCLMRAIIAEMTNCEKCTADVDIAAPRTTY
jgi:ABC-type transporter Mla MlaB component